jgi:maleylacetate reductase
MTTGNATGSRVPAGTHHWPAQQRVLYGVPYQEALAKELERSKARRVFVNTTRSLTEGHLVAGIIAELGTRFAGKFHDIAAHSPRAAVIAGASAIRAAEADLIVAVGGGSVIDATKVMLIALWRGFESAERLSEIANRIPEASAWDDDPQRLRMIAIPTTLSAAEFSPHAGITDPARKVKEGFQHPLAVPKSVILDPEATRETPLELLLSTGMRAVDHAVEGWCATRTAPLAEVTCLRAMQMLATALPAIKRDPADMPVRLDAQLGMWLSRFVTMAGIPYGASHGLGYLLGAYKGVPHGITSCLTLHAALAWNEPVNADRQRAVAEAFGRPGERASVAMREFVASLGLPTRLGQVGIGPDDLPAIAGSWDGAGPLSANPRPVSGTKDLVEILSLAL